MNPYSLNQLQAAIENGQHFEYTFFWGHKEAREGVRDKSCFSQWFPAPFVVEGVEYATAEHWMMAEKARLFNDAEQLQAILATPKPAVAKACGRLVKDFDATLWKKRCFDMVVQGNRHKFSQYADMRQVLLYTGKRIIVEASPRDRIWGIGMGQNNPDAQNPFKWQGTNLLGFALTQVRDELQK
jgi:ribA/ribD-fused uncharacterized protein